MLQHVHLNMGVQNLEEIYIVRKSEISLNVNHGAFGGIRLSLQKNKAGEKSGDNVLTMFP